MLFPSGALLGEKPGPVDMQRLAWTIDPAKRLKMDPLAPQVPRRGVRWRVAGKRQFGYVVWLNRPEQKDTLWPAPRELAGGPGTAARRRGTRRAFPHSARPLGPTIRRRSATDATRAQGDGGQLPRSMLAKRAVFHATLAVCIPRGRCAKIPSTMLDKGQKVVPCSKTST